MFVPTRVYFPIWVYTGEKDVVDKTFDIRVLNLNEIADHEWTPNHDHYSLCMGK